ncbi:MAG: division/cell wall cluster transcriptional repressor MraZ [Candidatus Marinimicrobia bacterium]|nr:division/cell wall cluster transcriptional repressor MraZ [Candidatus Neomarinimicrobiota bacterium]
MDTTGGSFTGSYRYTLDSKGRVNIPSKMRKALGPANDSSFVATRSDDSCIVLYPIQVWKEKVEEKLLNLNKGRAIKRHYTRNRLRHAKILQYDAQGRVQLPAELIEYAGITKDIEIIGMIDNIEIWDPDQLQAIDSELSDKQDELEAIAEEIGI